jgi:peptidoglycan/xylan/chitin deacetylase (PgdA/CDA1 family)
MQRSSLVGWTAATLHSMGLMRPMSVAAAVARRSPAFLILSYHRVNDEADPFFPAVPSTVFERHMAFVAKTYRVLTIEDLAERLQRGTVPRRALALTFDDGYRDNLTHAAPILARHGLPATVFLATGFIGTAEVPWFDRLAMVFKMTGRAAVVSPWGDVLVLTTPADRLAALDLTLKYLKRLPDEDLRRHVDTLLDALAVANPDGVENQMLTWDEVRALTGLGFSIGAHTVSHPILSRVPPTRARWEIEGSRAMIHTACGFSPRAFAYPNGRPEDYTETVTHLVREARFTCAVTTCFGVNTRQTSPWELRRGGPWEPDLPTFALKLAAYQLLGHERSA